MWGNFNDGCYDATRSKSEKFTHIFSYQIGAVTTLPPLQESRPEILGLNEVGGVFLTETSLAFPSCFFFSKTRPPEFWGTWWSKRGVNLPLIPKRRAPRRGEAWIRAGHHSFSAGVYSYEPYWVVRSVVRISSLLVLIWCYPELRSILEKTVAPDIWWNRSPSRGVGYLLAFEGRWSTSLPLFFDKKDRAAPRRATRTVKFFG